MPFKIKLLEFGSSHWIKVIGNKIKLDAKIGGMTPDILILNGKKVV